MTAQLCISFLCNHIFESWVWPNYWTTVLNLNEKLSLHHPGLFPLLAEQSLHNAVLVAGWPRLWKSQHTGVSFPSWPPHHPDSSAIRLLKRCTIFQRSILSLKASLLKLKLKPKLDMPNCNYVLKARCIKFLSSGTSLSGTFFYDTANDMWSKSLLVEIHWKFIVFCVLVIYYAMYVMLQHDFKKPV